MVGHGVIRPRPLEDLALFLRRAGAIVIIGAVIVGGSVATSTVLRPNLPLADDDPPASDCLVSDRANWDWTDCTQGTVINDSNNWTCNAPLANFGDLPIVVVSSVPGGMASDAVNISANCTGDGDNDTVDLILNINGDGDGGSVGTGLDAIKVGSSFGTVRPHDLQITGYAECGPVAPGGHQDTIQALSGERITFVNLESGDVDADTFTCNGAGGSMFPTSTAPGDPDRQPIDIVCDGCVMVTSNHGLNIGWSLRSGARNSTFLANTPFATGGGSSTPQSPVNTNNTFIER